MPSITVGPLSNFSTLQFSNAVAGTFAATLAQTIANNINSGLNGGTPTLNQFLYPQGARVINGSAVAGEDPRGFGGVAAFQGSTTPQSIYIDGADQFIVVAGSQGATPGPVSLQGGAAGGFFLAGAGVAGAARNVTYTNITPTGTATDTIDILGGNNLIQTATFGTGIYNVQTGDGNDTINILLGNSSINAGAGQNQINLGTGSNFIASVGNDTITGIGFGSASGTDTVIVTSGATSINSGGSSFLVGDNSPNRLFVNLGGGVDSINIGGGAASALVTGLNTSTTFTGVGTIFGQDLATGDSIRITGNGSATVTARGGADTISAQGSNGTNLITAGTGNDTLIAGVGNDTLAGGRGSALLQSGTGGSTTFSFASGMGGADTISGLKGTDVLSFTGFGPGSPLGVSSTGSTPGGTTYSLSDGTTLTILGAQPGNFQVRSS